MAKTIKAWWFGGNVLGHGDGREVTPGTVHTAEGAISACANGLHGSRRVLDALAYSHGTQVWRVELSGDCDHRDDKIAASERRYLWSVDAGVALRRFGCREALRVLPDNAAPCIREYLVLADRATEVQREAAYRAAYRASHWAAHGDAEAAALWAAHWARAALWAASWATERATERARQNRSLTRRIAAAHRRQAHS